jgi:hypothetical protein
MFTLCQHISFLYIFKGFTRGAQPKFVCKYFFLCLCFMCWRFVKLYWWRNAPGAPPCTEPAKNHQHFVKQMDSFLTENTLRYGLLYQIINENFDWLINRKWVGWCWLIHVVVYKDIHIQCNYSCSIYFLNILLSYIRSSCKFNTHYYE